MAARMNDAEAIMWMVESDPFLRSDFMNVTVLDRPPGAARLRTSIGRAIAAYPPLRQRVIGPPLGLAPPVWADDPDFDIEYHLRHVAIPPPGGMRQLLDLAAALAAAPLDRARPLWEVTVVEGLVGGRAAALQRLHHSLTDGVGGVKLLRTVFERSPDEPPAHREPSPDPLVWRHPEIFSPGEAAPGALDGWLAARVEAGEPEVPWPALDRLAVPLGGMGSALAYRLGQGLAAARKGVELAGTLRSTDELRLLAERARRTARSVADQVMVAGGALSPLMEARSLTRCFQTHSLDLAGVREAGRRLGGSRNDVFVAGVTGALLAYHEQMGAPCEALRMAVPLSLHGRPGGLGGNHFALARTVIPLGPEDPAKRLARTREVLAEVAAEPGLNLAESLAGLVSLLPPALLVPALRAQARTVDFAVSIVPGLRADRWLAGGQVEGSWPMGPRMGCAVNLTLLACGDRLDLGVNLDPAAVTHPTAFMDCLRNSFEDLLQAG